MKISKKYYDSLTTVERNFLISNCNEFGVQSCKTVISLARKNATSEIEEINNTDIISIGGVFSVKMKDCNDILIIRLSSGMIGDKHKVYINNN
jgi:hypothetical protein